jgi:hypothetical protein
MLLHMLTAVRWHGATVLAIGVKRTGPNCATMEKGVSKR